MSVEISARGKPVKMFAELPGLPQMAQALSRLVGEERVTTGAVQGTGSLRARLCPGARAQFWPTQGGWSMGCDTQAAGPGAHAALLVLLDQVGEALGLRWQVQDPSGYAAHHDFGRLRAWYISRLRQLSRAMDSVENVTERPVRFLHWPVEQAEYPVFEQGVVTPMGWFENGSLAARAWQDVEALSLDMYVWPNEEMDGWYWRNHALWEMWNRVQWVAQPEPAEAELIRECARALEQSAALDEWVPLPRLEYEQLCACVGERPQSWSNPELACPLEIGYRKQDYRHSLPPWTVTCDGALVVLHHSPGNLTLQRGQVTVRAETVQGSLPPLEGAVFTSETDQIQTEGRYEISGPLARMHALLHARDGAACARVDIAWPAEQDDGWARVVLGGIRYTG